MISKCHLGPWSFCNNAIIIYQVWVFTCCWSVSVAHCFCLPGLFICRVISFSLVMRKLCNQTMLCKQNSFSIFVKSHFSIELILIKLIEIVFIVFIVIHALICGKCVLFFYLWIFIYCLDFLNNYMLNMSFLICLSWI